MSNIRLIKSGHDDLGPDLSRFIFRLGQSHYDHPGFPLGEISAQVFSWAAYTATEALKKGCLDSVEWHIKAESEPGEKVDSAIVDMLERHGRHIIDSAISWSRSRFELKHSLPDIQAINQRSLAARVLSEHPRAKLQARLISYMAGRQSASYADVSTYVYGTDGAEDGAIKILVYRVNDTLLLYGSKVRYRPVGQRVEEKSSPE
jgi:hypothetical protein